MKKLKHKTEMLRRNGPVVKSVESVLRLEGSLWWERFVKEGGQNMSGHKIKSSTVGFTAWNSIRRTV